MKACTLVRCIDSLQLYIFCVSFNFHYEATAVSSLVIYDRTANLISSFHSNRSGKWSGNCMQYTVKRVRNGVHCC